MEGTDTNIKFFSWWYREACLSVLQYLKKAFVYLFDLFSVKNCLVTLFSPWKRDYINTEGLSLQDRFQVLMLNTTSRLVGMIIKISTILTYIVVTGCFLSFAIVLLFVWFFYPLLVISLIVYGFGVMIS